MNTVFGLYQAVCLMLRIIMPKSVYLYKPLNSSLVNEQGKRASFKRTEVTVCKMLLRLLVINFKIYFQIG